MERRTWSVRDGRDLGRSISEVRRSRRLSQADAAKLVGLSRDRLAKLEVGPSTIAVTQLIHTLRRLGADVVVTFSPEAEESESGEHGAP